MTQVSKQGRPADAQDARARLHDPVDRPLRLVRHRRHADLRGAHGLPLLVTENPMTADEFDALLAQLGWSNSFPVLLPGKQGMPLDNTRAEETNVYPGELLGPVGTF